MAPLVLQGAVLSMAPLVLQGAVLDPVWNLWCYKVPYWTLKCIAVSDVRRFASVTRVLCHGSAAAAHA